MGVIRGEGLIELQQLLQLAAWIKQRSGLPTRRRSLRPTQATCAFAQKDCSPIAIVTSKVDHRHSHLHSPLQPATLRLSCVMPELFKDIVSGIPLTTIEELNPTGEARITKGIQTQRLAVFLEGNLRKRMDSGVTSSISSGPMYSKALSKVI